MTSRISGLLDDSDNDSESTADLLRQLHRPSQFATQQSPCNNSRARSTQVDSHTAAIIAPVTGTSNSACKSVDKESFTSGLTVQSQPMHKETPSHHFEAPTEINESTKPTLHFHLPSPSSTSTDIPSSPEVDVPSNAYYLHDASEHPVGGSDHSSNKVHATSPELYQEAFGVSPYQERQQPLPQRKFPPRNVFPPMAVATRAPERHPATRPPRVSLEPEPSVVLGHRQPQTGPSYNMAARSFHTRPKTPDCIVLQDDDIEDSDDDDEDDITLVPRGHATSTISTLAPPARTRSRIRDPSSSNPFHVTGAVANRQKASDRFGVEANRQQRRELQEQRDDLFGGASRRAVGNPPAVRPATATTTTTAFTRKPPATTTTKRRARTTTPKRKTARKATASSGRKRKGTGRRGGGRTPRGRKGAATASVWDGSSTGNQPVSSTFTREDPVLQNIGGAEISF